MNAGKMIAERPVAVRQLRGPQVRSVRIGWAILARDAGRFRRTLSPIHTLVPFSAFPMASSRISMASRICSSVSAIGG